MIAKRCRVDIFVKTPQTILQPILSPIFSPFSVGLDPRLSFVFAFFSSFLFCFFFPCCTFQRGQNSLFKYCLTLFMGPTVTLFKFFLNGSYGTIHIFKNYFVTVFSIFSFIKNKLYPNGLLGYVWDLLILLKLKNFLLKIL